MVNFKHWVGARVEFPAHYDIWMRGARYGEVTSVGVHPVLGEYFNVKADNPRIKRRVKIFRRDWAHVYPIARVSINA